MGVVEITSNEHFETLTNNVPPSKLVILCFQTEWAEPCAHMTSVFASLAEVYPQHDFLSIEADKFPDISEMLDVNSVPYFVLLRNKTIIEELSGADPKALAHAIQSNTAADPSSNGADGTSAATMAAKISGLSSPSGSGTPQNEPEVEETKEDLNNRLKKLISAAPVMLFMKGTPAEPKCGFSRQLVGILRDHQVRFGFFDILKDNAVRQGLKELSDWPTFPQLYINGELQGGLDIVKESVEDDPHFFDAVK